MLCPRHGEVLHKFKDKNFPKDLEALKCPVCHSFWFERGDLSYWQDFINKKYPQKRDDYIKGGGVYKQ